MTAGTVLASNLQVGATLDRSFSVLVKNIVPFTLLGLVFTSPVYVYELASSVPISEQLGRDDLWPIVPIGLSMLLPYVLIATLVYGTTQELRGHHASLTESIGRGLAMIVPVFGVTILFIVCVGLGFLLLIIPGIILMAALWTAIPVAVLERPGVFHSLRRSWHLTAGQRWRIIGVILILIPVHVVWSMLTGVFVAGISYYSGPGDAAAPTAIVLLDWLFQALVGVFYAILPAVIYFDLRNIKEGADIHQIAAVFD